jgi:hypothetical protein
MTRPLSTLDVQLGRPVVLSTQQVVGRRSTKAARTHLRSDVARLEEIDCRRVVAYVEHGAPLLPTRSR